MTPKVQVLLVGSGGVGTIASLALELSGKACVTSVIRSDYNKVKESGFDIESIDYGNHHHWRPSHIANSVDHAVSEATAPFEYIVVCTKVLPEIFRTEDLIRPAVTPGLTTIVLIQNGIEIEKPVADAFPKNIVLSGVSMIGSTNYGGKIIQPEHDKLTIGYYESGYQPKEVQAAHAEAFVGIYATRNKNCEFASNLTYARWKKLVYNSTINTICALTQIDTGRAYLSGLDVSLIRPAMAEIIAVAEKALGESLPHGIDTIMLHSDDGLYYKPSMQVDTDKGNPMEIEAILGNPLRVGKRLGVQTPILSVVYRLLRGVQFRLMEERCYITVPENPSRKVVDPLWIIENL
jgi:2-dehydropantoate 2-reductase